MENHNVHSLILINSIDVLTKSWISLFSSGYKAWWNGIELPLEIGLGM